MLSYLPLLLFVAVIIATLVRGRAVRLQSGTSAWAFLHARGSQRATGAAFALSGAALIAATVAIALGHGGSPALLTAGGAIVLLGASIVIVAQVQMGNAWRVGVRDGDAPLFVTSGLFGVSRNPIFVGMILMATGAAVAGAAIWISAAAIAFAAACYLQVRIEEAHLSRQFGAAYDDFRRRVPRWLRV